MLTNINNIFETVLQQSDKDIKLGGSDYDVEWDGILSGYKTGNVQK